MGCKGMFAVIGVAAVAGLLPAPARAADAPRFEITPFAGYRTGGNFDIEPTTEGGTTQSADIGDSASFGVDLGLYRDRNSFYEFLYSRQGSSLDSKVAAIDNVDVTVEYYQFGGTAIFPQESEHVLPYLSLTLGATRFTADGYDSDTKFSASLGGGLRVPFNEHLAATLGLRGYVTFIDSNTQFLCVSNGGESSCLLRSSGSTLFQAEAQLGLAVRF